MLGRRSASPGDHEFRRNRKGNDACVACGVRRVISRDGTTVYRLRGGEFRPELPKCGIRIPEHARVILAELRSTPGGLTAAELSAVFPELGEEKVRWTVDRLDRARHIAAHGAVHAHLTYTLAPKGAAYLEQRELQEARKLNPAPKGRPRKYAIGASRPSYYKPTGRPRGRPRQVTPAQQLERMNAAKPVGRPRVYDDVKHEQQRAYTRRWREAKARGESLPKKTIAALTPAERAARAERIRERQRVNTASWRRWRAVSVLAARHVAALPPDSDELSSYALEWLGRAA